MNIVYILLPLSLLLAGIAVAAFFWAISHRQFDDLDSDGTRLFFEPELEYEAKADLEAAPQTERPLSQEPRSPTTGDPS